MIAYSSDRTCPLSLELWFADAAFCISKHPTSVKSHLHFRTFLPKSLHNPNKCLTFAAQEPAKSGRSNLELPLCRKLMQTMGGNITLERLAYDQWAFVIKATLIHDANV